MLLAEPVNEAVDAVIANAEADLTLRGHDLQERLTSRWPRQGCTVRER